MAATAATDSLLEEAGALRRAGDYATALVAARRRAALLADAPEALAWERGDSQRLIELLVKLRDATARERADVQAADSLGAVYAEAWRRGDERTAFTAAERQLALLEGVFGLRHPELGQVLARIGQAQLNGDRFAAAETSFRRALRIREDALGGDHPLTGIALGSLANLQHALGDYDRATTSYRRVLATLDRAYPDGGSGYHATGLNNLGIVLQAQGEYFEAEACYRQALAVRRRRHGPDHAAVASSLINLGRLYRDRAELARAEPLFDEALAIQRSRYPGPHRSVAATLNHLGLVLMERGELGEAERRFAEALAMQKELWEDGHGEIARSLHNLSNLRRKQGRDAEAEALLEEAVAIWRERLGPDHPRTLRSLGNLALIAIHRGRLARADSLLSHTLSARRERQGERHPDLIDNLLRLGDLAWERGEQAAAVERFAEAARVFESARARTGEGFVAATSLPSPYSRLAGVLLELGREDEAWPILERSLGRTLADLLLASDRRRLHQGEKARERSLARALGESERRLASLRRKASAGEPAPELEAARDTLLAHEAEWARFRRDLAELHPLSENGASPLAEVQAALAPGEAIVGWLDLELRAGRHAWAYAIRREGRVTWRRLAVAPGDAESQPERRFRAALAAAGAWPLRVRETGRIEDAARAVWTRRIEPLSEALAGVETLHVIPSGPMLGLPIEALVDEMGASLDERFAVTYAPSATVLAWLRERPPPAVADNPALLVGDPDFAASGPAPLPGTRAEVNALAELFPDARLLLGAEASERRLGELADSDALAGYSVLHLATHAAIDDRSPDQSALLLAEWGADPIGLPAGDPPADGRLSVREILRDWELDAELVALSACGTALGRSAPGEGHLGFAHAFLQAGARGLLLSLWEVEDRAATMLMSRFYANLRGSDDRPPLPRPEALREAKRWLRALEEDGDRPFRHPAYWAAFVLVGAD